MAESPVPRRRSGTNHRRRSAQISVRLTPVEESLLRKIAAHDGVSPGEVFRRAVFDTPSLGSPTGTPAQERAAVNAGQQDRYDHGVLDA